MPHFNTTTQQRTILRRIDEAEAAMLPPDWKQDLPAEVFTEQPAAPSCCGYDCRQGRACPLRPAPAGRTLSDVLVDAAMLPVVAVGWLAAGGPFR
jgi:hypothetical protein